MKLTRRSLVAGSAGMLAAPFVARAQSATINLVFSHHMPTAHIGHKAAMSFANAVKAQTNGQVTVDIKPASQLFNLRTSAEALQLGTLDMCWSDLGTLANWTPHLGFVSLPFLFNDFDHVSRVLYGATGRQVAGMAKDALGVEVLCLGASGFRVFLGRKPMNKADDVRGIRLRVPEIPTWVEMARALGANPTPLPFPEVYGALEQKAIDGQENPISVIAANKFWEVQKHMAITNHQYNPQSVIMSKKVWDSLSAADRKIIDDAADDAAQAQRTAARAAVAANLELLKKNGMTVTQFSPAEVAKLREKMKPVITKFSANVGEATVNEVLAELAKLRR